MQSGIWAISIVGAAQTFGRRDFNGQRTSDDGAQNDACHTTTWRCPDFGLSVCLFPTGKRTVSDASFEGPPLEGPPRCRRLSRQQSTSDLSQWEVEEQVPNAVVSFEETTNLNNLVKQRHSGSLEVWESSGRGLVCSPDSPGHDQGIDELVFIIRARGCRGIPRQTIRLCRKKRNKLAKQQPTGYD